MKQFNLLAITTFLLLLLFSSCEKKEESMFDSNGIAIELPTLWRTEISNNVDKLSEVVVRTPIFHGENSCLVGANNSGMRTILSLNSIDGKANWKWNDLLSLLSNPGYKDPISLTRESYHQINNKLFFNYSSSSYCIDLSTGTSLWKYKSYRSRFSVNGGIDETYFTSGSTYEPQSEENIYSGSMESGVEEQLFLKPEYTLVENPVGYNLGMITYLTPFKEDEITYLAFGIENPYTDFTTKEGMGSIELNLFNITENKYEYKKVVVNPNRETRVVTDLLYQTPNLYFQSSNYIHGVDAMTGVEHWRTYLGSSPLTSRMILADNKLFSACEDRFLYCVDVNTGRLLWKEQNTGTCSELSYLNGVVYYLGGGDGLLHAVDAETGKHLWKISSPDLKANSGAWFYGVCVAVPGKNGNKGVVVATTGLHAYGYKAIR